MLAYAIDAVLRRGRSAAKFVSVKRPWCDYVKILGLYVVIYRENCLVKGRQLLGFAGYVLLTILCDFVNGDLSIAAYPYFAALYPTWVFIALYHS